jgi:hypothetical protein
MTRRARRRRSPIVSSAVLHEDEASTTYTCTHADGSSSIVTVPKLAAQA